MRNIIIAAISISSCFNAFSQTADEIGIWLDHLPYGAGVDVIQQGEKVYVAVEQGMFTLDLTDRDIQRFSKLNGLSDVNVTAMAYSDARDEIILGYANANIDIVRGEEVNNVPDITLSSNFPGLKTVNHLYAYENLVYISTDFGIVVLDLDSRIIKETYIIGEDGATIRVNQVVIDPMTNLIYAATDVGVFSASMDAQLQTFESWSRDTRLNKKVRQVTYFKNTIVANKAGNDNNDSVFLLQNGNWEFIPELGWQTTYEFTKADRGILAVCNNFSAQGFDENFQLKYNINRTILENDGYFPQAAVVSENPESFWSVDNSDGLFLNYQQFSNQQFLPNSPASKSVYDMITNGERLFVAPGSINGTWAPLFNNAGFYILEEYVWDNVAPSSFNGYQDIIAIIGDPADKTHFYASAYDKGILEFEGDVFTRIINSATVGSQALPDYNGAGGHRIGGFSYDPDGNIWFTNSLSVKPLGRITEEGAVESFSLGSAVGTSTAIKDILYTTEDQIWIQTRSSGIVVTRQNGQGFETKKLQATENQGNLPTETVLCFAEDKDGEVWIGTNEGVAVLYSPRNIFEPNRNYDAQRIIIDEDGDGLGEPFLGGEAINDIVVDGSNKKWFATSNSGVFYTSDDGRQEIYHFTKENSPLLSNNVLDIEVDDITGMVYFGTDQGIVSFQGVATEGSDFNEDVYAYPNPVEPGYEGPILIRGLVTNAQVKITDVQGNIVYETVAEGGQAIWSGRNFDGTRAHTGVYLAYITDDLGSSTAVAKILIVN